MKTSQIMLAVILGVLVGTASCRKSEEVTVELSEEVPADVSGQEGLAGAMKRASVMMRRLSRAVENNDWVGMDMWTQELKEGIGFNCVELYMIENNDIPKEFTVLSNKFNSAINKLILCSKTQDAGTTGLEFNNLVKSCEECHKAFNKDMKKPLDFTGSGK